MCNMRTIGSAVSEKKIFEIVDDGRTDGRTDDEEWVYYKLTYEPSTQKKKLEFILRINAKMVTVTFKSCINFLSQLS